jgi:hypothetical protein
MTLPIVLINLIGQYIDLVELLETKYSERDLQKIVQIFPSILSQLTPRMMDMVFCSTKNYINPPKITELRQLCYITGITLEPIRRKRHILCYQMELQSTDKIGLIRWVFSWYPRNGIWEFIMVRGCNENAIKTKQPDVYLLNEYSTPVKLIRAHPI